MEKLRPGFDLEAFKSACGDPGRLAITTTALATAAEIGFGRTGIAAVVRSMRLSQFRKSMTSHADHRRWQDVYYVPWEGMTLYVKFTKDALTGFVILSFKEK